jgi:hypothetical protein
MVKEEEASSPDLRALEAEKLGGLRNKPDF